MTQAAAAILEQREQAAVSAGTRSGKAPASPAKSSLEALRFCDMGLLMGAPVDGVDLHTMASILHTSVAAVQGESKARMAANHMSSAAVPMDGQASASEDLPSANATIAAAVHATLGCEGAGAQTLEQRAAKKLRPSTAEDSTPTYPVLCPIPRKHCPSIIHFQSTHLFRTSPVVISGAVDHWHVNHTVV